MLLIIVTMLVILVLAGLVLVYAAFPHRGEKIPAAPWLGDALERATDKVPTIKSDDDGEGWAFRR